MPPPTWKQLVNAARAEVNAALDALPPEIAERARPLPLTFEPYVPDDLVEDGLEPDLLGLFVGSSFAEEIDGQDPIPPQIFLYLDSIYDFAEGYLDVFQAEVRKTYLHELGHYLGLEEDELIERGMG